MDRQVTITYLEMRSVTDLKAVQTARVPYSLVRSEVPSPELNRFLYVAVGAHWFWHVPLAWDYQQWMKYLDRPELQTWVAYVAGVPAGYFELEQYPDRSVEIAYFGLLPQFIGKGLGGSLLTSAIKQAWKMGASRVWVHTCNLDHPQALSNYIARGFHVFHRKSKQVRSLPYENQKAQHEQLDSSALER